MRSASTNPVYILSFSAPSYQPPKNSNSAEKSAQWFYETGYKDAVVRWERVNGYLKEFGFRPLVGEDDFIPTSGDDVGKAIPL